MFFLFFLLATSYKHRQDKYLDNNLTFEENEMPYFLELSFIYHSCDCIAKSVAQHHTSDDCYTSLNQCTGYP